MENLVAVWQNSRQQGFLPHKINEIKPDSSAIDELKAFPFLGTVTTLNGLKQELPLYLAKAVDVSPSIDALTWCRNYSSDLPFWSEATRTVVLIQPSSAAAERILLIQPSSAAAERIFSLVKNSFDAQDLRLQDYIEFSLMLQYNICTSV